MNGEALVIQNSWWTEPGNFALARQSFRRRSTREEVAAVVRFCLMATRKDRTSKLLTFRSLQYTRHCDCA